MVAAIQGSMATAAALALALTLSHDVPEGLDLSRHWITDPIRLEVITGHGSPGELLDATRQAAAAWNAVGAGPRLEVVEANDENGELLGVDGASRVGVLHGGWPYPSQAGAATVVWASSSTHTIFESDVALNPSFRFSDDNDEGDDEHDLVSVMAHELGHVLGLPDLVDQVEATMYPAIPAGETKKRDLSDSDVDTLIAAYQDVHFGGDADPVVDVVAPVEESFPLGDEPAGGCSQAGAVGPALLALCALLFKRRAHGGRVSSRRARAVR